MTGHEKQMNRFEEIIRLSDLYGHRVLDLVGALDAVGERLPVNQELVDALVAEGKLDGVLYDRCKAVMSDNDMSAVEAVNGARAVM